MRVLKSTEMIQNCAVSSSHRHKISGAMNERRPARAGKWSSWGNEKARLPRTFSWQLPSITFRVLPVCNNCNIVPMSVNISWSFKAGDMFKKGSPSIFFSCPSLSQRLDEYTKFFNARVCANTKTYDA